MSDQVVKSKDMNNVTRKLEWIDTELICIEERTLPIPLQRIDQLF